MFYSGLLPFVDFDEACLSIPMLSSPHIFQEGRNRWYLRWLLNAVAFILESPVLYKHLQSRGLQVFFWVLNDDDDFHRVKQRKENGLQLSWTPAHSLTHSHTDIRTHARTHTHAPTRTHTRTHTNTHTHSRAARLLCTIECLHLTSSHPLR